MRWFLLLICAVSFGIAPARAQQADRGREWLDAMKPRADSLLALPSDSLSAEDGDWLREYGRARSEAIRRGEVRPPSNRKLEIAIGGALTLGVALLFISQVVLGSD